MLDEPAEVPREDSDLLIVMMTDGNPCLDCDPCCANSIELANGADVLRQIRDNYEFTFVFVPIVRDNGGSTISLDVFDDARGPQGDSVGLSEEEFITVEPQGFEDLNDFLTRGEFTSLFQFCL